MSFFTILKIELKKNIKSILKVSFGIALFTIMLVNVFDPDLFAGMDDLIEAYPQVIKDMVGGMISMKTIGGFLTMEFFSIVWLWVGINIILKSAQDIPTAIDNKSIDLVLSKPIKRWEYALGKHLRFIIQMIITFTIILATIIIFAQFLPNLADEEMDMQEYLVTFLWALLFCLTLECTGFFFSTLLPRKKATGISFMIFIIFFIIGNYYSYFNESLHDMRFFSVFTYYDPGRILIEHSFMDVWTDMAFNLASDRIFGSSDNLGTHCVQ